MARPTSISRRNISPAATTSSATACAPAPTSPSFGARRSPSSTRRPAGSRRPSSLKSRRMAGEHETRDRHLFGAGPKRLLSLDGGVRGVISVAFLERIEALLREQGGENVWLGDWFDLIGGTSTGS